MVLTDQHCGCEAETWIRENLGWNLELLDQLIQKKFDDLFQERVMSLLHPVSSEDELKRILSRFQPSHLNVPPSRIKKLIDLEQAEDEKTGKGFRLETGTIEDYQTLPLTKLHNTHRAPFLERLPFEGPYMERVILNKECSFYVCDDEAQGPAVISVFPPTPFETEAFIWTKRGSQRMLLTKYQSKRKQLLKCAGLDPETKIFKVRESRDELVDQLLQLNRYNDQRVYKFGVIFSLSGQNEDQMLSNDNINANFEEFLGLLGDRIPLKGWTAFRGGLDVKEDTTGTHSVYTNFEGMEIMFHVSTLLPHSTTDNQQLERKRHIGNDVVVIIFHDGRGPFCPLSIRSQFNHVFVVVSKVESDRNLYQMAVASQISVSAFGPTLPIPAVFEKGPAFRNFLLTKLINAERSALQGPSFSDKMSRVRSELLREIVRPLLNKKSTPSSRKNSGHSASSSWGSQDENAISPVQSPTPMRHALLPKKKQKNSQQQSTFHGQLVTADSSLIEEDSFLDSLQSTDRLEQGPYSVPSSVGFVSSTSPSSSTPTSLQNSTSSSRKNFRTSPPISPTRTFHSQPPFMKSTSNPNANTNLNLSTAATATTATTTTTTTTLTSVTTSTTTSPTSFERNVTSTLHNRNVKINPPPRPPRIHFQTSEGRLKTNVSTPSLMDYMNTSQTYREPLSDITSTSPICLTSRRDHLASSATNLATVKSTLVKCNSEELTSHLTDVRSSPEARSLSQNTNLNDSKTPPLDLRPRRGKASSEDSASPFSGRSIRNFITRRKNPHHPPDEI